MATTLADKQVENIEDKDETIEKEDESPKSKPKIRINIDASRHRRYTDDPKYFACSTCSFKERYDYFGRDPPFIKNIQFRDDVYIAEDPFSNPGEEEYIILGAHCLRCLKNCCRDSDCSFYYEGTYCLDCVAECYARFPEPVRDKVEKMIKRQSLHMTICDD